MGATSDSLRVLLVEDNPGDAAMIEEELAAQNGREFEPAFELVHVEALRLALDRLENDPYDVVLLDLGLPESTGIDTAERVLREYPNLPVVVLTGLANRATALEAIRAGAQDYLNKDEHLEGPIIARAVRYAAERHARERALQLRTQRIEQFASVISHELRNPLNIARGYADLLDSDHDPEHVAEIDAALDRIDDLIDKLLELSDLSTSEGVEAVDVGAIAEHTWAGMETGAATIEIETPLPTVAADAERLGTLFEHLFANALEHGTDAVGSDEVAPAVTVGPLGDEDGFFVEDDGPGFTVEERTTLFEPEFSAGGTDPELGLTIAQSVVEEHGWEIRSAVGSAGGARIEVAGISNTLSTLGHYPVDVDATTVDTGDPSSDP